MNADIGHMDALWVEEKDEHINPIGPKGMGEHATGKHVRDLLITLDRLLV